LTAAPPASLLAAGILWEAAMADTVRLEIEYGDIDIEFEGPAEFAKKDLLPLIGGLIEKLADFALEDEEEGEEDEDEEKAEGPEHKMLVD
jgi:hypothetical protein